jgi:hypothetical protein
MGSHRLKRRSRTAQLKFACSWERLLWLNPGITMRAELLWWAMWRDRAWVSWLDARTRYPRIAFRCNICSTLNRARLEQFSRETPSCRRCGSTVRMRSVVHCLSLMLFGRSLALSEMPADPAIRGIGLSDWEGYASRLAGLFFLPKHVFPHGASDRYHRSANRAFGNPRFRDFN